jgi:hypothetical protein
LITDVLLGLILVAFLYYSITERREARHYRKENLQAQVDALVYDDYLARELSRRPRYDVLASRKRQRQSEDEQEPDGDLLHGLSVNGGTDG